MPLALSWIAAGEPGVISGVVTGDSRPVTGAVVRIQATSISTTTNERGEFSLKTTATGPVLLTGFAAGYYIAGPITARPGDTGVRIALRKHTAADDPSYVWTSALASAGQAGKCQTCHSDTRHRWSPKVRSRYCFPPTV